MLSVVIYGTANRIRHFAVGKSVSGFSGSLSRSPSNTLLVDISQRHRFSESFGNLIGYFSLGYVLGFFISGPAVNLLGYSDALYALIIFQVLSLVFLLRIKYEQKTTSIRFNIGKFFHKPHRNLKVLAVTGFLVTFVESMDATVTIIFLRNVYSASITQVGFVLGIGWFCFGVTQIILGKHTDRLGRKRCYVGGIALACLSVAIMPNMPSLKLVTLFFALLCVGHGIAFPAIKGIMAGYTSDTYKSQDFGFASTFEELGRFIGFPIVGLIADMAGFKSTFYLRSVVLIMAAIIVYFFIRERD